MRGNTLNNLIQMLRRDMKIAESPALGKNSREGHAHAIRSAQERLFAANNWPFKIISRDVPMVAGQRYYAPPADLNFEDIRSVDVLYSGQWFPVKQGITVQNYNVTNSDTGQRLDPVLRWQFFNDPDNGDMIEAWPIPASNGFATLRFKGVRKLGALVANTDVADLDDLAIVLQASADLAPIKEYGARQAKCDRYVFSLLRNLSNTDTFISGGGRDPTDHHRQPRIVITPLPSGG